MKFGAVPESLLSSIDLSLPKEPFINTLVLPGVRVTHPQVYVGAANWGDPSWNGDLYPSRTPATRYRQMYPLAFRAIELNATHYRIYDPEVIRQWRVPAQGRDFKFCPKFPQEISHNSGFRNTEALTAAFLQSIAALDGNLGPVFLQLSENDDPSGKEQLFHYLAFLPNEYTWFLEVRHPKWFSDPLQQEALFTSLRDLNIGAVITDTPGRRDAVHMHLTMPKVFLRFVCNRLHPTSFSRSLEWIDQIAKWIDNGLEEAYIFLHPGDEAAIPDLARFWTSELNARCGLQLPQVGMGQSRMF